jgi:hypothetical protein
MGAVTCGFGVDRDEPCTISGEWFRNPGSKDNFRLKVWGSAARWKIRVAGQQNVLDAAGYSTGNGVYSIKMVDTGCLSFV